MRLKKGFTLAEILIVLMVIGVIATLTIPSMMKGVTDAQLKTGYKKAYNTISNIAMAEKVAGFLPATNISDATMELFRSINVNLSATSYVSNAAIPVNSGRLARHSDYQRGIRIDGQVYGDDNTTISVTPTSIMTVAPSPWIVTEDNMAYSIMCGGTTSVQRFCATRDQISALANQSDAVENSCAIVIVDVNGLSKGPNTFDPQAGPANGHRLNQYNSPLQRNVSMEPLTGDQFLIFLGRDGASAGPKLTTVTGRIMSDMK